MPTDSQINHEHETKQVQEQESVAKYIERQYLLLVNEIAPLMASGANRATINRALRDKLRTLAAKLEVRIETGIQRTWQISNDRTHVYLDKRLKGFDFPDRLQKTWYDPNEKALRQFLTRKEGGLTLSERVWKTVKGFNDTVNAVQEEGISKGEGAAKIARRLRSELRNPTREESPGQGVYKSPLANSLRLTRTEINRAYRLSDHEKWKNNPIIIGYEIRLSATQSAKVKARCEICRQMTGKYPVDFIWAGWHP